MLLAATLLPAQEKPEYTFGTTVVSSSWLQGQIYAVKPGTEQLPRLRRMKPTGTIYTNKLNVSPQSFDKGFPGITDRYEWFAIDYNGKFWIEQPGEYRFELLSDDGSKLEVDKKVVVDNDGIHAPVAYTGTAVLSRGVHAIRVSYYQGPRTMLALVLKIGVPGADWRIFNIDEFPPPKDPAEWIAGKIGKVRKGEAPY